MCRPWGSGFTSYGEAAEEVNEEEKSPIDWDGLNNNREENERREKRRGVHSSVGNYQFKLSVYFEENFVVK